MYRTCIVVCSIFNKLLFVYFLTENDTVYCFLLLTQYNTQFFHKQLIDFDFLVDENLLWSHNNFPYVTNFIPDGCSKVTGKESQTKPPPEHTNIVSQNRQCNRWQCLPNCPIIY